MGVAATVEARLGTPVIHGGAVFFNYPPGHEQADFLDEFAVAAGAAVIEGNDVYEESEGEVVLVYETNVVQVSNLSGVTWPAGARVQAQLAFRELTGSVTIVGGGGLTLADVNNAIEAKFVEDGVPTDGPTLTALIDEVISEAGAPLTLLGTALASAAAEAEDAATLAVLARYEALAPEIKAAHMGAMLETTNAGEFVIVDDLRRTAGMWFVPPTNAELISGTPELSPADPEAMRALRDPIDLTDDIAGGALEVDLSLGISFVLDFDAALSLSFAEAPIDFPPQTLVAMLRAENVHGTTPQDISIVSGGGSAVVTLHGGLATPYEVTNGAIATFWLVTDEAGGLMLMISEPT